MQNIKSLILIFSFLFSIISCSSVDLADKNKNLVNSKLDEIFNNNQFSHALWGVKIQEIETGEVIYQKNSNKVFMPASNQKIITSAAALSLLKDKFTFSTKVYYDGEISGNILKGNLFVWSNGDPTLYNKFYDSPTEVFANWADSLINLGISEIEGDIIAVDNAFSDNSIGYGWALNYLDSWYAVETSALNFNENYVDLLFSVPDKINEAVSITPNIKSDYIKISNKLISSTDESSFSVFRPFCNDTIFTEGLIKIGEKPFEISLSIKNPSLFYVNVLKEIFLSKGIKVSGIPKDCDDIQNFDFSKVEKTELLNHYSPNILAILKGLMKRSQNLYAEIFPRVIAYENEGIGEFEIGKKYITNFLSSVGVNTDEIAYMDGSGLSRYNFVSPDALITLLDYMYKGEFRDIWLELFPISGVDGTLKNRLKNGSAYQKVFAKTGTISNVRALSGYFKANSGKIFVFSFLVNSHLRKNSEADKITDSALEYLIENY